MPPIEMDQWRPKRPKASLSPLAICIFLFMGAIFTISVESSPQNSLPSALMSQLASLTGQRPKVSQAPVLRLDFGSKYYKVMIEGMMTNFKMAVKKASEKSFTLSNLTSIAPISIVGQAPEHRVSVQELQIDGLHSPKVSQVHLSAKDMKLHVVFNYKTIKVSGRCSPSDSQKPSVSATSGPKLLLEATNWNSSWSASVMPMVGRDHFDLKRVSTSHSHQSLSLNLKECPRALHDKLKVALVDRIKSSIESRLVEIMEDVIMQPDAQNDDFNSQASSTGAPKAETPKGRGKRASELRTRQESKHAKFGKPPKSSHKENPLLGHSKAYLNKPANSATQKGETSLSSRQGARGKVLKRVKRQTPCQPGEELDDYVDQLFRFGTRLIRAMEPVVLPNATIELPDYNLKIFLYEGKGTRVYKFKRAKKAWVFCSNETISLGVTIVVEELRVAYKYRVISGHRLLFDGDLEAKLSPRVQAQFSQAVQEEDSEEPVQQRVDRVRVFRLGVVHVVIRGLGNLTQSLSLMINSYLNDNQEELQPMFRMVEGDATKMINKMLASVNVPLLSVV